MTNPNTLRECTRDCDCVGPCKMGYDDPPKAAQALATPQPAPVVDAKRAADELASDLAGLSHAGYCRVWQHGADEERCECGLMDARSKASELAAIYKDPSHD